MSERRSLTPLESELRIDPVPLTDERPSLLGRFHAWRARREPPTTRRGVIAHGLLRLTIALGVATGLAFLVDHFKGGNTAVGFYIVGAALLAVAFMTSATSTGSPYSRRLGEGRYSRGERERRVNMSFSYILAGAVVIGIGVAIEALTA